MLGGFDAIIEPYGSEELSMDFGLNLSFLKKNPKIYFLFIYCLGQNK